MLSIVISLISGIALAFAFPKANLHWLAWFSLAPLMYYTYDPRWKRALICGLAFGVGFFGTLIYWLVVFGTLPWVALAVFQSLFIIGFVLAARLMGQGMGLWARFVLLPAMWLTFEWVRSLGMFGFTWGDIGYSQYKVLPLIQIASVTGVWGLSFLLAMSNAALSNLLTARKARTGQAVAHGQIAIVLLLAVATVVYGLASLGRPAVDSGNKLRAAVIQGNVDQGMVVDSGYTDRTWQAYSALTLRAGRHGADIVVWPETVVPGYARDWYVRNRLESLAAQSRSHLLVGGWDQDSARKVYNSVFLIAPKGGITGRYAKVHLVPFGEYVPARKYLPFLEAYHVTAYDTSPGAGFEPVRTGRYNVGVAICFESIFPEISRRLVRAGADVLCVITNDCWYDKTAAAEQHMEFCVFRAVENRRWLMRGATTGISCIIDPQGRIVSRAGARHSAIVQADIRTISYKTFYSRHGDWLVYSSHLLLILLLILLLSNKRISPKPSEAHK
jgi:apolipoprotein N-acyltransferase